MIKAVIFDFDGTLTKEGNCWHRIWTEIDDLVYDAYLYSRYKRKEFDESEWIELICQRFVEKQVNMPLLVRVAKSTLLQNGAVQTIKQLHNSGKQVYILSGGVRQIIELILKREGLSNYITSIECYDFLFNENGYMTGYQSPEHNPDRKYQFIERLKSKNNLKGEEIFFVGNDFNDEEAYKSGAVTLCVNPLGTDIKNKKVWTYGLNRCNDLREILSFIKI